MFWHLAIRFIALCLAYLCGGAEAVAVVVVLSGLLYLLLLNVCEN